MDDALPAFRDPPVIETALSIQFPGLRGFGNAHLGLFWSRLREEFPHLSDADPILSQREVFGEEVAKPPGPPRVRFGTNAAARLQMTSSDQTRMVQVQNGRLVFNWRRVQDGGYPRWHAVKRDLFKYWSLFLDYLGDSKIAAPQPNQWEVVYVNHLPKGRDWDSPEDWAEVVPGLLGPSSRLIGGTLEALSSNWHIALNGDRGRLHIDLFHAFTFVGSQHEAEPIELLNLQLTARGPVGEGEDGIDDGLELGHAAIVQNFAAVTGDEAHRRWGRES